MSHHDDYYLEAIHCGAEEAGLNLTDEQAKSILDAVTGAMENESLAFGRDCIPNPLETEIRQLKAAQQRELADQEKRVDAAAAVLGRKLNLDPKHISVGSDGRVWYSDGRTSEIY